MLTVWILWIFIGIGYYARFGRGRSLALTLTDKTEYSWWEEIILYGLSVADAIYCFIKFLVQKWRERKTTTPVE